MSQMMRRLTDVGLKAFQEYLDKSRKGEVLPVPSDLLTDTTASIELSFCADIDNKKFSTRYELGSYLVELLKEVDLKHYTYDPGFWSWLGLFYFDQLCLNKPDGTKIIQADENYILSTDFRRRERHAVRTTYYYVKRYGENVLFMFSKPLHQRGEILEQISQRQDLFSNDGVIGAASLLYNDPDKKTFKRGAASKGGGTARRFVTVLQQFEKTYDLFSMNQNGIYALLPKEFSKFKAI